MKRLLAALLFCAGPLWARSAQVTMSASTSTATIGQHIELRVVVRADAGVTGIRVEVPGGAYEIVRRKALPPVRTIDGCTFEEIITIAFFQTGEFTIGPFPVELLPRRAAASDEASGQLVIRVRSLLGENDKDIKPLKEPFALRGDPRHLLPFMAGLLLLLLLALSAWLLLRYSRMRRQVAAEPALPPEIELEMRLQELRRQDLPQAGEFRRFFIALSAMLKHFIGRAYGFNAEDCTTEETRMLLDRGESEAGIAAELAATLEQADLVKFARQAPEKEFMAAVWPKLAAVVAEHKKRRRQAEEEDRVQAGR